MYVTMKLLLCILAFSTLAAGSDPTVPCPVSPMRHGPSVQPRDASEENSKWISQMRQQGIKSVGVEAEFYWNGRLESVSVTNLTYYNAVVTLTSGQESRILETVPSNDSFSEMLASAAGPFVTRELQRLLPA